jgi:hypothetical protein
MSRTYRPIIEKTFDCLGPSDNFSKPVEVDAELGELYGSYFVAGISCNLQMNSICANGGEECPYFGKSHSDMKGILFPYEKVDGLDSFDNYSLNACK